MRFGYEIIRVSDGQVIAEGETGHVVTDGQGRVRSFPEAYNKLLSSSPASAPTILQPKAGLAPDD
jgi:acyl-CoA thioesterase FadM